MLPDELRTKIEEVISELPVRFGRERSNLIPALQYAQGNVGYLPEEVINAVSRHLRVPASTVYGAATFYAQFRFTPIGRNVITVCRGTACHVRGSQGIIDKVKNILGIGPGETTPDLEYTLQTVACFGSCALAPVALVNGKVHGRQSPKSIKALLDGMLAPAGAEE